MKSVLAQSCVECYKLLRTVRADYSERKIPLWQVHDECPQCGGEKMFTSKLCRECWLTNTRKPARLCEYCGEPVKDRRSRMCVSCRNARVYREEVCRDAVRSD